MENSEIRSKDRRAKEITPPTLTALNELDNHSGNSSISSDTSTDDEDRLSTCSKVSNKLSKKQSEGISGLTLDQFKLAEHTINKSHNPNDIFSHFAKIVKNTLENKLSKSSRVTKQTLADLEEAVNYTKSRIAEATKLHTSASPDKHIVQIPALEDSILKLQGKFDKFSNKLNKLEDKIDKTKSNTQKMPEIAKLIPELHNTLQVNEKALRETKETMSDTQNLMEKIDKSTEKTIDLGAKILKNMEILTANTYTNLERLTTKTFENMTLITKNTYETMENLTVKALDNTGMAKAAKKLNEIPDKINKIIHSNTTPNIQQSTSKENKEEQKRQIRITLKKEAPNKEAIPYLKSFFKDNNLPTPQDLTQNKLNRITIQMSTIEELELIKSTISNNVDFKLNFIINKHVGQRTRLLIFNTLLPEVSDRQEELLQKNEHLKEANVSIVKTFKTKKTGKLNLIIEVDKSQGDLLLQKGNVFIDFQRYSLTQYKDIKRCYNCQAFGHYSGSCKEEARCQNCGDGHNTRDCNSSVSSCANCKKNNHDDTSHNANSLDCPVYQAYRKDLFSVSS